MKTLIVAGGVLDTAFLKRYLRAERPDYVIAADSGLDVLDACGIRPDLILGDYDSLAAREKLERFRADGTEILTYPEEKDFSDSEAALREAVRRGSASIDLLGGCGGRLDHFLANVLNLKIPLDAGIPARILDERNEIFLADRTFYPGRREGGGRYISFLPLFGEVTGLTLRGFRYPLEEARVNADNASLTISNEITSGTAEVVIGSGILAVVRSKD